VPTLYHALTTTQLTAEQCAAIEKEYYDHTQRCTAARTQAKGKNIIFIIVESYLSATSELIVDGKEVTPFLNTLRHDSTVYYNGRLRPDISVGESSDGQFLYMAGLLPLRSDVTVTKAKYAELPGLPKILCLEGLIAESQMIIPTLPSMWEQEKMCQKYGFDHLYSSADYQEGKYWYLSDEQIFQYALEKNLSCQRPFLSVILTMTMHQPYTEPKDPQFTLADKRLTEKYRNYLSTCHYTDRQIKWYFEQLKKNGLYDNSIIVVAADHHAHPSLFDMGEEDLSTDIPLYIVGGGIDKEEAWQGPCHQLDVYTTLLDLIGTKNPWHGFGHTLLTPQYQPSVRAGLWTMSEQIVLGNYFSPKNSSRSTP
jgi:lipoteichoic acid synthase